MNVPPGGGGPGTVPSRPSHNPPTLVDPIRSSPQLLKQLTSPTVGPSCPLPSTNNALEYNMLPRSPLPIGQASYYTPSPRSPYGSNSPTYFPSGGLSPTAGIVPRPTLSNRTHRSPATSPARKRLKLDLNAVSSSPKALTRKLFEWRTARLRRKTSAFRDNMAELFFIKNGTNVTDNLPQFRKKPTQQFVNFLKAGDSPARVISEVQTAVLGQTIPTTPTPSPSQPARRPPVSYSPRIGILSPVKVGETQDVFSQRLTVSRPAQSTSIPPASAPIYSPDQVSEKMKQEGWVVRRVAELSRDGLWPAKRMPQVAERPRPMSSWDMVLEEMKWMAFDFSRERHWKKAVARLQSAACREHVVRRQEQEQAARLEQDSEESKKAVARLIAGKVSQFWGEVENMYRYELVKRNSIYTGECLVQQTSLVSENPELNTTVCVPGVKRKLSEISSNSHHSVAVSSVSPEQEYENGIFSDCESTISEQESWELLNCVSDCEITNLNADMAVPIEELLHLRYPGFQEDLRARWEESSDTVDCVSDWDTDSECESEVEVNIDFLLSEADRTKNGGFSISELSAKARSLLPKSVITYTSGSSVVVPALGGVLKEHQQVALDWLATLHRHSLPALLVDDRGLGRKVTISAFLSYLVLGGHSTGTHLVICPVSALSSWESTLAHWVPSLIVTSYNGNCSARRRVRDEICLSNRSPHVVLTSYRTLFLDADWFLTRPWSLLVQAEAQNVISAGSADQIRTLVNIKAQRRILLNSGAQKANPIDLWNTVYLLFPGVYSQRSDMEVEVEGTLEYTEIVQKLQTVLSGFSLSRTKAKCLANTNQETRLSVSLGPFKRKLYEDFLAQPSSQECLQRGEFPSTCGVIQSLREICNEPFLKDAPSSSSLPKWCFLDQEPPKPFTSILGYDPLANISLDQVNLVFLTQELTTTVLTSARLRSIKASRKLIAELPHTSSHPPLVPRNKLHFSLEGMSRGVGGWAVGGLGEGVSLVRAANGQVYKVATSEIFKEKSCVKSTSPLENLGALHPESIETIAAVNRWRCDGFPLYGQDLIKSLTITNSVRPVQSRYRGQGYVNCLNASLDSPVEEVARWKYSTSVLPLLCDISNELIDNVMSSLPPRSTSISDCKMKALFKLLASSSRGGKKAIVVTSFESVLEVFERISCKMGIRYCTVRGTEPYAVQVNTVTGWRVDERLSVLVLAGVESQAGLNFGSPDVVILLDSGPGIWEPRVDAPLYRIVAEGTVEEGLHRVGTIRKILQDVDSSSLDTVSLSKQTLQEIFHPQPDNGFLWHNNVKKKEKGMTDIECIASLSALWGYVSGGTSENGSNNSQCLLDLAELETGGEITYEITEMMDSETVALKQWLETIMPVTRYGMRLLRDSWEARLGLSIAGKDCVGADQLKIKWESKIMDSALEDEETLACLVTYQSDLVDREWRSADGLVAGVYKPPNFCDDLLSESIVCGYSKDIIEECDLPAVHIKKEKKVSPSPSQNSVCPTLSPPNLASQMSPSVSGELKPKIKREDLLASAPKSLFDRPKPPKAVPRRPPGLPGTGPFNQSVPSPVLPPTPTPTPLANTKPIYRETDAGPEWTIQEDWALHQAVTAVQELPLSLTASSPGHISNWDMVADMVNAVSRCFRSGKQCRARYESTVVPREEGRIMIDVTPTKKLKKAEKLGVKINKKTGAVIPARQAMKTSALFKSDNNNAFSTMFSGRFETIKSIANKRTPTTTPLLVNPTMRNPKHAAVLAESGISYDTPLTPVQVAANRAERIQRDKARTAQLPNQPTTGAAAAPTAQPQLPQSPVAQSQANLIRASVAPIASLASSSPVPLPTTPAQAVVVGISQPLQQVSGQQAVLQNSASGTTTRPAVQQAVTALSVQDILKNTAVTTIVSGTPAMFTSGVMTTSARIQTGQVVMTQAGKAGTPSSTVQVGNRQLSQQLTPQQLQQLKQQTILKKNQDQQNQIKQRLALSSAGAAASSSKVTVAGTVQQGQTIGRGQMVKQNVRSMTEPEIKALLARQQLKVGQGGVVQVPANTMSAAQLQLLGIQVSTPASTTATLVKTVTAPVMQMAGQAGTSKAVTIAGVPGVNLQTGQLKAVTGRGAAIKGSPQQMQQQIQINRQLQLITNQKGLQGQRVALSSGKGLPAQLIVQGGSQGKGLPTTVTVQQLQQIVKSGLGGQVVTGAGQGQQIISHVVQAKPGQPGQTVQARVIPVSGATRGQPTIQVVQAAPPQRAAPNVTINQMAGRQTASDLASALAAGSHVKIQAASSQQILSQVSAALAGHGQNVSVAVRTPNMSSTAVLPPGATVVQQGVGGLSRIGGQQMVNLQLSVAGQAQPQPTQTSSSQASSTE